MGSCASQPQRLLGQDDPGSSSPQHVVTIHDSPVRANTPASKQRIADRLQEGKAAGRNFQNRVALPMALSAGLVLVALLALTYVNASSCAHEGNGAAQCGLSAQFVPFMGTPTVAIVLLLAILPTQTELVAIAGWVAFLLDMGVGSMMAVDLSLALWSSPDIWSDGLCADIFTHEQQSCLSMAPLFIGFFTWFYIGVVGGTKILFMMRDNTLHTRTRLEQIWLLLGTDFLIGECGCHLLLPE
jgi:hypothetical protein